MKRLFAAVLFLAVVQAHAEKAEVVSVYASPLVGSYKTGDRILLQKALYVVYGERPCGLDLPFRNRMRAATMNGQQMCALVGPISTLFQNPLLAPSSWENVAFAVAQVNEDATATIVTPGYDSRVALLKAQQSENTRISRNTSNTLPPREAR